MNRKNFLRSATVAAASSLILPDINNILHTDGINKKEENNLPILPPYLKKTDIIGISAPAGYITVEEIQPAVKKIESWGYTIRIGKTIGEKNYTFAGTDEERANDLQQMLDDTKNKSDHVCKRRIWRRQDH
jgi:muramoyltetrapeptide carboxypeptidase